MSEVTTNDQHARGTCRKCGFFKKECDDAVKVCCCHETRVEFIDPPLLPDTYVPVVSDLQQTPDREQISSQPSCVSGSSALSDSSGEGTEPQEIFDSVSEKMFFLGSGSFSKVFMAIHKSDGQEVAVKSLQRLKNDITISVVFNLPTSSTDGTRNTGNILVNTRTFNIKLIDFGCALEYTGKPYPNHKYRGAYDYWPPEVKGKAAFEGKTTNVYHLGKLLQKMFPGCRPGVSQGESSDKNTVTHS
ncbi:putative serine/threonine-protein kinase pim-1-like [Triplophysa rosa]|uniref:non-specific serine/threonine protein kinase n=1 Tax=Triplophysa rosa TaxID=992332 RepID=A0A9W7WQ07_TRIRA|nr:putative serine/threonine-protein kinase pim-1-like [Triplophysa rosa]